MLILAAVATTVQLFLGHLQAGRNAEAYALMAPAAKQTLGRAQFDAYIASRKRVLGPIRSSAKIRESKDLEIEGMKYVEANVRFRKGTSPSWFLVTAEEKIYRFALDMPPGTAPIRNDAEAAVIFTDILESTKSEGVVSLAGRFHEKDLQEAQQTPEQARAAFERVHAHLGRLRTYTLGKPAKDAEGCMTARGEGKFEFGDGPIALRLCWADGVWRLRHAEIEPVLTPLVLERSLVYTFEGKITASCPRMTLLPIGGRVVCRVTPAGEPPRDVTIERITTSGWKIVATQEAK